MVGHPIILRGLEVGGASGAGPTILARSDDDFIEAVLAELRTPAGRARLAATIVRPAAAGLQLYQPVQRVFHVALFELACDPFGAAGLRPRLDPRSLRGAGMVVRRRPSRSGQADEGWREAPGEFRGWLPFAAGDEQIDPDPGRRPPALRSGVPEIDGVLALSLAEQPMAEQSASLFVAPPDVCAALGKTVLYGVVPLASAEQSEAVRVEPLGADFVRPNLTAYLRPHADPISLGQLAGRTLTSDDATSSDSAMRGLMALVRQVYLELDAFGSSAASRALRQALDAIALPYPDERTRPAGAVLREAASALVDGAGGASVTLPERWPALSAAQAEAVVAAATATLNARAAALRLAEGRYDQPGRRYTLRAFARVAHDDHGCPPELFWSEPSAAFTIAPWYASGPAPLARIELPNVLSPEVIRGLKPNVAFSVPPELQNMLAGLSAKDLIDGKGGGGGGSLSIEWICSFSIPIITLCAFIVLNIFLQLLNIIFQWLLWVKICIPIPRRSPPGGG